MRGLPAAADARPADRPVRPLQLSLASLFFWTAIIAPWLLLLRTHVTLGVLLGVMLAPPLLRLVHHMSRKSEARPWSIERQYVLFIESCALTWVAAGLCGFYFVAVGGFVTAVSINLAATETALTCGAIAGGIAAGSALYTVVRDHW